MYIVYGMELSKWMMDTSAGKGRMSIWGSSKITYQNRHGKSNEFNQFVASILSHF